MVLALSSPGLAHAGAGVWTTGGPGGEDVYSPGHRSHRTPPRSMPGRARGERRRGLQVHRRWTAPGPPPTRAYRSSKRPRPWPSIPRLPSITLRGDVRSGVFKSTNSGGTWAAANTGLPSNLDPIFALAIDPTTPRHALRRDVPAGSSSPRTPAAPGPPPTRACTNRGSSVRPRHRSHDPRHALRRDVRRRRLQVHRLRRLLGRRQHGPDVPWMSAPWPSIPRPRPRSTPATYQWGLQVHELRGQLGPATRV